MRDVVLEAQAAEEALAGAQKLASAAVREAPEQVLITRDRIEGDLHGIDLGCQAMVEKPLDVTLGRADASLPPALL